jgi:hypothetical protein
MFVPSASHFLSTQKVTKKGTHPLLLRKGSAGQRTTTFVTECLIHYDYNLSLIVQSLQLTVFFIQIEHVLCANTADAELPTFAFGLKTIE